MTLATRPRIIQTDGASRKVTQSGKSKQMSDRIRAPRNGDDAASRRKVRSSWLNIVKNLSHHPRTETVPLPSGCSFVPQRYTRLQRSFLDLVEAARHLRLAGRCLCWSWLGVRAAFRDSAICCIGRRRVAGLRQKEGSNASCWHHNVR